MSVWCSVRLRSDGHIWTWSMCQAPLDMTLRQAAQGGAWQRLMRWPLLQQDCRLDGARTHRSAGQPGVKVLKSCSDQSL